MSLYILFSELPFGHVIVITVYAFLSMYYEFVALGTYISHSTIISLGTH